MVTIHLQKIRLHAFHGIHEEERKTGSLYEIDMNVNYEEGASRFISLGNTISYVDLFELIKQRMQLPTPLLEKVCLDIIEDVRISFPFVNTISISIYKLQPPIENFEGRVGVTISRKFNE